ncbi:MAG: carboxymethylenebutenolidase [Marinicaulis sp.]|nr:carboxymethylenebutenolidase [Marinicaulis sp.]
MAIATRPLEYEIDGNTYEAIVASDGAGEKPGVLVCHAWAGRSDFEVGKAKALAELGYTGVAIDLYGKGVLGSSVEENQALMTPFMDDRTMLQGRLGTIVELVKCQREVDAGKVAIIGFCFGGLCALDAARSNNEVAGVVSFHGLLGAPGNTADKINAKILALHGWDDPMAPPGDVIALGKELTNANADWQLHGFGGVMHAFTNPAANDADFGTVYNADADRRSWIAMKNFMAESFE